MLEDSESISFYNDENSFFPFLSNSIIESEENFSDDTTGITGQMLESLKKKRKRVCEPDENGSSLLNQEKDDEIKIFDSKIDEKNKKVCRELIEFQMKFIKIQIKKKKMKK